MKPAPQSTSRRTKAASDAVPLFLALPLLLYSPLFKPWLARPECFRITSHARLEGLDSMAQSYIKQEFLALALCLRNKRYVVPDSLSSEFGSLSYVRKTLLALYCFFACL
jgi:hypothetical protein